MAHNEQQHCSAAETILIESELCSNDDNPQGRRQLHLLPFHIDYTGTSDVSKFFHIEQSNDGGNGAGATLAATFRGHLMLGQVVQLPAGYQLCAAAKADDGEPRGEEKGQKYTIEFSTSTANVWCHEEQPSVRGAYLRNAFFATSIADDLAQ